MSTPNVGEKTDSFVVLNGREMADRAAVAATLVRRAYETQDCSRPLSLGLGETVKLGQLARFGSELYVVRHRHNAVANGFAQTAGDYEQMDTYYFINSVQAPTTIEVYRDDLQRDRELLEGNRFDQLKYWMGEKETIFAQRTHGATEREAQLLSRALNQL